MHINYYDRDRSNAFEAIELEQGQSFDLLPGEYILVSTLESVTMPNDLMGVLYPRSSTNRRGLSVDLTGIIDSGYEGQLVIPIRNNTSSQVVKLYPGERFCQLVFDRLDEAIEIIESRYHRKDIIEGFIRNKKTPQDEQEIDLVSQGKINELKKQFGINNT
jgi:dCTP deaminase